MYITIKAVRDITIIITHLPQAARPLKEKEDLHWEIEKIWKARRGKGPIYMMGDFNVKLGKRQCRVDREVFGKYTYGSGAGEELSVESRDMLVTACRAMGMVIMNTTFDKKREYLATWRHIGVPQGAEVEENSHEQIDFIIAQKRWRNTVEDVEADNKANIKSDHAPVVARVKIKLKAET